MRITYKSDKIERACTDFEYALKKCKYSQELVLKLHLRIKQIKGAQTVEEMLLNKIGRCHKLSGNRKNQYAVDLVHPQRLVFTVSGDEIQIAEILEITDYH
jgi:proteic killer suppression protein